MADEQPIGEVEFLRERNAELQARIAQHEQVVQEFERALAALRRSETKYRTLIDQFPCPVFLSRIDDFTFTEVNDRACTNYGYSREEFLTMQIFDIETAAPLRQQVRDFYDSTAVGQVVEVNGMNRRKDGSTFPVHVRFTKLDDEFAMAVVRDVGRLAIGEKNPLKRLTNRELQILRLIGVGRTTRQIADELRLRIKTIESHRDNIRNKLQIKNGAQLIHYAVRSL